MRWEYVTIDKLGYISRGRSKHRPRNDKALFGGKYPFVQTADVKAAELYLTEYTETYNERGLEQSKLWKKGTLCITIAANIADTAILGMDACFPDSVMGFIPFEGVSNVKFVKYAFDILQRDCQKISQGTAQDNLSWKKLSTIKFPAPPIEIQDKIVNILSIYDNLIENNQRQIKLLEETAQRLYKEWFVDLRFPGYEDVEIVDGVPEGWKKLTIASVAELKAGGDKPKDFSEIKRPGCDIPVYANGISKKGLMGYTSKATINQPSVTISARGTVGVVFLRREAYTPIVRLISITPLDDKVDVLYLYLFLLNESFRSTGAAQQQITVPLMRDKMVMYPSVDIINEFNRIITSIFDKIDNLEKQIDLLSEARDRLLAKLMSGELEV